MARPSRGIVGQPGIAECLQRTLPVGSQTVSRPRSADPGDEMDISSQKRIRMERANPQMDVESAGWGGKALSYSSDAVVAQQQNLDSAYSLGSRHFSVPSTTATSPPSYNGYMLGNSGGSFGHGASGSSALVAPAAHPSKLGRGGASQPAGVASAAATRSGISDLDEYLQKRGLISDEVEERPQDHRMPPRQVAAAAGAGGRAYFRLDQENRAPIFHEEHRQSHKINELACSSRAQRQNQREPCYASIVQPPQCAESSDPQAAMKRQRCSAFELPSPSCISMPYQEAAPASALSSTASLQQLHDGCRSADGSPLTGGSGGGASQVSEPQPQSGRPVEAWEQCLSPEQRAAAEAPYGTPQLVLAGPGSGKTSFLVARVAGCMCRGVCPPQRIAVVTFTSRAAEELALRIQRLSGAAGGRGTRASSREAQRCQPWVGTIHRLALRLLREAGGSASQVASEDDRRAAAKRCLAEFGSELKSVLGSIEDDPGDDSGAEDEDATATAGGSFSWPSRSSEGGRRDPLLALLRLLRKMRQQPERWASALKEYPALGSAQRRFTSHLRSRGLLDVADIVFDASNLLQNSAQARRWAVANIEYLFVDEWQDTDGQEVLLLQRLLQGRNAVSAVGDDDQQIYSWRKPGGRSAAPADVFREAWPAASVRTLGMNFRCTASIMSAAARLIACNTQREAKALTSSRRGGCEVVVVVKPTAGAEAAWVAAELGRLKGTRQGTARSGDAELTHQHGGGGHGRSEDSAAAVPVQASRPWGSFAVLARTSAALVAVEQALLKSGIPTHIPRRNNRGESASKPSGRSLDLLAYLRLAIDDHHNASFLRVCNLPRRGLGKKAMQHLHANVGPAARTGAAATPGDSNTNPLDGSMALDPKVAAGIATGPLGARGGDSSSLAVAMRRLLDTTRSAPSRALQGFSNFNECVASIRRVACTRCSVADVIREVLKATRLMHHAGGTDATSDVGVARLLHQASRYVPSEQDLPNAAACITRFLADLAGGRLVTKDSVTLSTIHGAKGLEWDCVVVIHCCEFTLPVSRRLENGEGNTDTMEEERRLMYVAMTRARDELLLTCPLRDCHGNATEPSRFLHEAKLLDEGSSIPHGAESAAVAEESRPGARTVNAMPGFQSARDLLSQQKQKRPSPQLEEMTAAGGQLSRPSSHSNTVLQSHAVRALWAAGVMASANQLEPPETAAAPQMVAPSASSMGLSPSTPCQMVSQSSCWIPPELSANL